MTLVPRKQCTLTTAREAVGLSMAALAKAANIWESTVRRIEYHDNNGYPVTTDVATNICTVLKREICDIMWPHGLSARPKWCGPDDPVRRDRIGKICPRCNIELPRSGRCQSDSCVE